MLGKDADRSSNIRSPERFSDGDGTSSTQSCSVILGGKQTGNFSIVIPPIIDVHALNTLYFYHFFTNFSLQILF